MCGLTGCAGLLSGLEERAFRQLLVIDSIRGEDSTGIAAVSNTGELIVSKSVGDPFQLLGHRTTEALFKRANRVLIGHNRYATAGKVTRNNAHPFEMDTLVGAHNGTLSNKYILEKANDFAVDSEALYHNIEEYGVENTIKKLKGSWSLTWFNTKNNTLHFLRNKERPMYVTITKDRKSIFWASEAWMLSAVLRREKIEFDEIFETDVDTHYTFDIDLKNPVIAQPRKTIVKGDTTVIAAGGSFSYFQEGAKTTTTLPATHLAQKSGVFIPAYLGSVIEIEGLGVGRDSKGFLFVNCMDVAKPEMVIRLYVKDALQGELFKEARLKGRIQGVRRDGTLNYYVIDLASVSVLPPDDEDEGGNIIPFVPRDHSGREITRELFTDYYCACGWCGQILDYDDPTVECISLTAGAFCKDCKDHPDVIAYCK